LAPIGDLEATFEQVLALLTTTTPHLATASHTLESHDTAIRKTVAVLQLVYRGHLAIFWSHMQLWRIA